MNAAMLGLLAETPIHPGAGRGMGVVDLPVAREAATDYPVIVGSSLKGALRDRVEAGGPQDAADRLFGQPDRAGALAVSDARLLMLPVRSLTSSFLWATCPHLLERYDRDLRRAGLGPRPKPPSLKRGDALAAGADAGKLFLEERQFAVAGAPDRALAEAVAPCVLHEETRKRLADRIAVLHDDDFAWFVRYGLTVQARNVLENESKKSINLWYEETLPPDTIMYSIVMSRDPVAIDDLVGIFPEDDPYLQAGGNETVGQGWFAATARAAGGDGE